MTFERAWVLWFLVLPLAWMAWEWRRQVRRSALLMKIAMAVLVILALAEPVLETHDRKVALAALVDTSASITPEDLARESSLLQQIDSARGSNLLTVIPFARTPRTLSPQETGFHLERSPGASWTRHQSRIAHPPGAGLASRRNHPSHRTDQRRQ